MSKKFSAARKRAFLSDLAETGNQTISAEAAKVSRSWVQIHRANDPGFDAACREAIEKAKARLLDSPSPRSSSANRKGGFFAGEELVISGTNGVRAQLRRARLKQWTPRIEERFLSALAASCNVKASLAAVGMSKASAYARRQRLPAFARAWDEAIATGQARLEAVLVQNLDYAFDPDSPPPEMMLKEVTVSDLIRTLGMYQRRG